MEKKLIVFDLDETLRKLEFDYEYKEILNVRLRPHLNLLLEKLKEVKENGTDIMIYTTASSESANKYFIECLPEEYRNLFCRVISRDEKLDVKPGSIEEKVYGYNTSNKPVTAIEGYDQILFFDDNNTEGMFLRNLYREEEAPNKQVKFVSCRFDPPKPFLLYGMKKISEKDTEIATKVNEYFDKLLEEPGCDFMVEIIDDFQKAEFEKGLTIIDKNPDLRKNRKEVANIEDKIEDLIDRKELSSDYDKFKIEFLESNVGKINDSDEAR